MTQTKTLTFDDALRIARGCMDYGGGYWTKEQMDIFHHGIQTVIKSLDVASEVGLDDSQIRALHCMGAEA